MKKFQSIFLGVLLVFSMLVFACKTTASHVTYTFTFDGWVPESMVINILVGDVIILNEHDQSARITLRVGSEIKVELYKNLDVIGKTFTVQDEDKTVRFSEIDSSLFF